MTALLGAKSNFLKPKNCEMKRESPNKHFIIGLFKIQLPLKRIDVNLWKVRVYLTYYF